MNHEPGLPLDSELRRLPEPAPPAGMAAAILERTARRDEQCAMARHAAADARTAAQAPARPQSSRPSWVAVVAGVSLAFAAQVYRLLTGESVLPLTSSPLRDGLEGFVEMPHGSPALVVLAAGLLLYVTGLFTSLRERSV